jgi:hypothetical protein
MSGASVLDRLEELEMQMDASLKRLSMVESGVTSIKAQLGISPSNPYYEQPLSKTNHNNKDCSKVENPG